MCLSENLSIKTIKELSEEFDKIVFRPNEVIIRHGAYPQNLYIVEKGSVEFSKKCQDGKILV